MYEFVREARLVDSSAGRAVHSWVDRGIRLYLVEADSLAFDSRFLRQVVPVQNGERVGQVTFQLSGALTSLRERRPVEVLDGSFGIESSMEWAELWHGRRFRALVLEWSTEWGAVPERFSFSRMGPGMAAAVGALAAAVRERERSAVIAALGTVYERLRAVGLDLEPWSSRRLTLPRPAHVTVARLLSEMRTNLPRQNGWSGADVASRSERQLRRDLAELYRSLGLTPPPLRTILLRERLLSGVSLLTSDNPSVELVAKSVGYGSSRAFGLALKEAGLPTATELVRHSRATRA